ncbi:MAG: ATP-binding cassette domain-containing protein [Thermodesulfobacteriota bacterium]
MEPIPASGPEGATGAIIRLFAVTKAYGKENALSGISLSILPGELVFFTGPSGAGKSTLLRLLYRAEEASSGQILVMNRNISRVPRNRLWEIRRRIGVVFQDFSLIPTRTVFDNVALPLFAAGRDREFIRKKVSVLLRNAGLEKRAKSYPQSLSGGEQQRVAVARAICTDPDIILADEPTASLDPEAAGQVMEAILSQHRKGATVLIATHDRRLYEGLDARVEHLTRGSIQETEQNPSQEARPFPDR